jgi:undecaprenyl-diphosphatase
LNGLDRQILLALRSAADLSDPVGPDWLQRAAVDLTSLGSHAVIALVVLSAAGVLIIQRRRPDALWLLAMTAGAMLLNHCLKIFFARARPDVVEHLVTVVTPSFPSGHALLSAAVYLALPALLGREAGAPVRRVLFGVAVLLTLLIGISRVYLGVHWPSDVLGGWIIGSLWAFGWLRAWARCRLQRPVRGP